MANPLVSKTINDPYSSLPTTAPPSKKKLLLSAIKRGLITIAFIVAEVAGYLFLGLAMSAIYPPLSMPLYVFASTTAATKFVLLAVKAIDPYHVGHLNKLKKVANVLIAKYPKLQLITLVFTIAISIFSQSVGCAVAGLLGVIFAVFISGRDSSQMDTGKHSKGIAISGHHSSDIMTY
jgi:hypothetical protein